eukprot:TRINITY_DN24388_c0_g1_i2.p2 TRINITY_DN24388_c0_g1~~TRINITY_DN24388_c0_g1_i2.p2  ORF type:complete len:142 (+),score=36.23 TRINITY_DN24388_c0_g1_i2:215-640(+)
MLRQLSCAMAQRCGARSMVSAPPGTAAIIQQIEREQLSSIPKAKRAAAEKFKVGDKLEVTVSDPGGKFTTSVTGVCIARSRKDIRSSFKLLSTVLGEQMEHHYHVYSPLIENIKVIKNKPKTRRAKLYYLRDDKNKLKDFM